MKSDSLEQLLRRRASCDHDWKWCAVSQLKDGSWVHGSTQCCGKCGAARTVRYRTLQEVQQALKEETGH